MSACARSELVNTRLFNWLFVGMYLGIVVFLNAALLRDSYRLPSIRLAQASVLHMML